MRTPVSYCLKAYVRFRRDGRLGALLSFSAPYFREMRLSVALGFGEFFASHAAERRTASGIEPRRLIGVCACIEASLVISHDAYAFDNGPIGTVRLALFIDDDAVEGTQGECA